MTRGFTKLLRHEALKIDREAKRIEVKNLKRRDPFGSATIHLYWRLEVSPKVLPIPGALEFLGKGVYICSNPEEGKILRDATKGCNSAVVIGGGAIGLELALALRHLGLEVTATKRSPQILGDELDPDMSELIAAFIKDKVDS